MLTPTTRSAVRVPRLFSSRFAHTHLVRGGFVMLRPTIGNVESCRDGREETGREPHCLLVGFSISDPPLTRWVCANRKRKR